MAWRIVRQPNGLLARFSEVVDDFTHLNMSTRQTIQVCIEEGLEPPETWRKMEAGITDRDCKRWHEALSIISHVHGNDRAATVEKEVAAS
jgi:hypothetical protein